MRPLVPLIHIWDLVPAEASVSFSKVSLGTLIAPLFTLIHLHKEKCL